MLLSMTAVRTAMMVITTGIVNMGKKSSMRIGMVRHDPGVTARFFDDVFTDNVFPCEWKKKKSVIWTLVQPTL